MPKVLEHYYGASGYIALDKAGDRIAADYELVEIVQEGRRIRLAGHWNILRNNRRDRLEVAEKFFNSPIFMVLSYRCQIAY
jgi:hypothetical protein